MSETRIGLKSEYVRVNCGAKWIAKTMHNGYSYGGNQGWFNAPSDGVIRPLGCGLISCADILLYKSGRTHLEYDEYKKFVRELNRGALKVRPHLGVNGLSMAFGIRKKLKAIGAPHRAAWCFSKRKMLERIKLMLQNDIPVTIAAGPCICFSKEKKKLYGVKFYTRDKDGSFTAPNWRSGLVRDHYVTVTGLIYTDGRIMLEISSWGERYYIDWEEYKSYIYLGRTFFSNIMFIR